MKFTPLTGTDSASEQRSIPFVTRMRPYRVLLVDDNDGTCQLIQDILEDCSDLLLIGRAGDGREAVALATLRQPDVILMDVNLPIIDGVQATYSITEICPKIVVIGISEQFRPSIYSAMRTAGAAAFACKSEFLGLHKTILDTLGHPLNIALRNRMNLENRAERAGRCESG